MDNTRLIIGTAQWGLDYGISNNQGRTSTEEIGKILDIAEKYGIDSLDTASAYGDAEKLIGKLSKKNNKIITKITIGDQNRDSQQLREDIRSKIENSQTNLGRKRIEGVLIHDPKNLEQRENSASWNMLKSIKKERYIKKVGISVYNHEQAEVLSKKYKPDIIQIPFNVFDLRATKSGALKRLKGEGIEIHARSIFLQGLLLMELEDISSYFEPWMSKIKKWHEYCSNNKLSLLEGAITNGIKEINIDKFIVGVENRYQLEQIIDATKKNVREYYKSDCSENDEGLINPSMWVKNR